jgi:hypothetical protein
MNWVAKCRLCVWASGPRFSAGIALMSGYGHENDAGHMNQTYVVNADETVTCVVCQLEYVRTDLESPDRVCDECAAFVEEAVARGA